MTRKALILIGLALLSTAALGFFSPVLGLLLGIIAFALLLHGSDTLKENRTKIENSMLVEDSRLALVVCDGKENILTYNTKGGEFFGTGAVFTEIKAKLYTGSAENINAFERLNSSLSHGVNTTAEIMLGPAGERSYLVETRKITGRTIWLISAEETTARHEIDAELKQNLYDIGEFFDFLPVGLFRATLTGEIISANARFCEYMGYSPEKITGKNLKDLLEGGDTPVFSDDWQGVVSFRTANGSSFRAFLNYNLAKDDNPILRAVVIKNVSLNSDEEREMQNAEKRFNWLFAQSPFGITFTDADGRIKEANPTLLKMLGTSGDNLSGEKIVDCIDEKQRPVFLDTLDKVLSGSLASARCEVQIHRKDALFGADAVFAVFIFPTHIVSYNSRKKINGFVLHFFDTTEWKNLEVQFEQAQKMQLVGQLVGGIAHDFNNILTAILGFCDLLMQRHGPGDPSFSDIFQIQQNSNRAANMVRQLLALSRKQSLVPKTIDTVEAFADITDLLRHIVKNNIEIKVDYGRDLGYIRVDPSQFEQIFLNLAVNARDAMHDKGTISIRLRSYDVDEPIQNDTEIISVGRYVMFEFKDSGCGIKKENIKRIFEPFFSTKSSAGKSIGLGLATVYGIIRQTGGFIKVESEEGKGTTFTILLPRYEAKDIANKDLPPPQEKALSVKPAASVNITANPSEDEPSLLDEDESSLSAEEAGKKRCRILLVEDEDSIRLFSARTLKNKGYAVTSSTCGEEALKLLETRIDFDLLITDMMMHGVDGATLAKKAKEVMPELRIIIMSGFSEDIAKGVIADNPEIHFLGKPFNLDQLAAKVKDVMA